MIDIPGIYVGRFKDDPNQSTMLMQIGDTPTYTNDNWANVESTGTIWRYSSEAGEWIDTGLEEILVEEVSGTKEIIAEGTVPWKLQGLNVYGKSTQQTTTGAQLFDISQATPAGSACGLTTAIDGEEIKITGIVSNTPADINRLEFVILNYPENLYDNIFSMDIIDNTGAQDFGIYASQTINVIVFYMKKMPIGTEINLVFRLMVNSGPIALPWEPYTGAAPSPSPTYPQPIINAGGAGNIDVNVIGKNRLNLSKATINGYNVVLELKNVKINLNTQYTFSLNKTVNNIQFGLFLSDTENISNSKKQYNLLKEYIPVKSSKSFIFPDNLSEYSYLAIAGDRKGISSSNVKNLQVQLEVGPTATPYEPYKGPQPLTVSTPNGLPGIPVDSGGNFTDADGQQWVCDVVDFERGVYVQRVQKITSYTDEDIDSPYMSTTGQLTTGATVIYVLAAPIETPLSPEELAAYAALMSYDGTTVISTDEDVSGISAKVVTDVISKNAWFDPYAELALYYKALAGFESIDNLPMPHSRESSLVRKLLDSSYELGFSVNESSSRNERYLWDLINGTSTMLTNVPKSDTEKFLHVMIGGNVEEYPIVDTELDYWMDKCVHYMSSNGNIGG